MNVSYKWLKEYVDFDLTPDEVAAALTSVGLEVDGVEEVQSVKGGLKDIVVGEVLTCVEHPNSDHLHVTTVNQGSGDPVQIVCGAPNVAAGQKVVVATLGAKIYEGDDCFTIKPSKLRGVESCGMLCSQKELGLGDDHSGIMVLPSDAVPGTPAAEYFHLESDFVIEVDITPNHSDACSHWGVARDFYAWLLQNGYSTSLHRPSDSSFKVDSSSLEIPVQVLNTEACPRYAGVSIKGVTVKESPDWLKNRLSTIGLHPINNIVDVTNYILFAYGQPLHSFDADKIKGGKVVVRTMPEGTPFTTLDGVERKLSERDLMICNAQEPMCMAGVFGGLDSGIQDTTVNVFLESAYFHPTWIRKSARRHQLSTDASFRFERGIDPNGVIYALKQAAMLIKELAGGEIAMEITDNYPVPMNDFEVDFSFDYADSLIGKKLDRQVMKSIVENLGIKVESFDEKGMKLSVPPFRVDVQRPCDIVEEILRIYGYNNIDFGKSVQSSLTVQGDVDRSHKLQDLVSEQLVGCGFNEILNNSLTRAAYYDGLECCPSEKLVRLMNPLSADLNVLRESLIFGGLESLSHNIRRQSSDLRFFEFGKCYYFDAEKREGLKQPKEDGTVQNPIKAYSEDYHLGLWITGNRVSASWAHADEKSSVYELKAFVQNIFQRLGLQKGNIQIEEFENAIFASGLRYKLRSGKTVCELGLVSRPLLKMTDVDQPVCYADINWDELLKATRKNKVSYSELPKYPAVRRDLALLIDKTVKFQDIERLAYQTEGKLLKEVTLFDVYEGKNLESGKKSYAVSFLLQDESQTLNDVQIEKVMNKLIAALQNKLDAKLR
ncbi:MAG: phenylalanine--tRNA ligase subunit beta [Bacteroidaceae bacterium]|nr:phenylalanine--tRNA ligase subunit beta [Bacteroidaceae bacterium]